MRPHNFPRLSFSESRSNFSSKRTHGMINEISGTTYGNLLVVIGLWEQIGYYMEGLLAENSRLPDPEYYDNLLTDNATFIRLKKYFWTFEFITEAETNALSG
jgi:hypothetical protein